MRQLHKNFSFTVLDGSGLGKSVRISAVLRPASLLRAFVYLQNLLKILNLNRGLFFLLILGLDVLTIPALSKEDNFPKCTTGRQSDRRPPCHADVFPAG